MDLFVILYALLFYAIGRWVKSSPSVLAGYYSIPKERRERVARQTADYFCRTCRVMALLIVLVYAALRLVGMDKVLVGSLCTLVISLVGTVWTAVRVQRYNRPE